jgi:hypothetical protein
MTLAAPVFVAQLLAGFFCVQKALAIFLQEKAAELSFVARAGKARVVGFTLTRSYTRIVIVVNGDNFCG